MRVAIGDGGGMIAEEIAEMRPFRRLWRKRQTGGNHPLNAGYGLRHDANLMPAAAGPAVVVVMESEADVVVHAVHPKYVLASVS
jgi:hypothetical protein